MRQSTSFLLLLLVANFVLAEPQAYDQAFLPQVLGGYLPPETCLPVVQTITSLIPQTSIRLTTLTSTVPQYITTVAYKYLTDTKTIYQPQIQTKTSYETIEDKQVNTVTKIETSTSQVYGRPVINTQTYTQTKIIPQTSYATNTIYKTKTSVIENTSTKYVTSYTTQKVDQIIPFVITKTKFVPGETIMISTYSVVTQTSTVTKRQPNKIIYKTTTVRNTERKSERVTPLPVFSTSTHTKTNVISTTIYTTNYQKQFSTSTTFVTGTKTKTQTKASTRYVTSRGGTNTITIPYEVIITKLIPSVRVVTEYETVLRPGQVVERTRVNEVDRTNYVEGITRKVTETSYYTKTKRDVTYRTQNIQEYISVTKTIETPCESSGYKYPRPSIAFNF